MRSISKRVSPLHFPAYCISSRESTSNIDISPMDMAGYLRALATESWEADSVLQHGTRAGLESIGKTFHVLIKNQAGNIEDKKKVTGTFRALLQRIMIRRTSQSRWFDDQPLIDIPPHRHQEVPCLFKKKYVADMNALIVIAETKLKEDCAARSAAWIDRGRIGEAPKRSFVRFS